MKLKIHPVIIISWAIMAFAAIYINIMPPVEPVPLRKTFLYFPFQIGDWKAKEKPASSYLITTLGADDILMRDYRNKEGDTCELYFSYFEYTVIHEYAQSKNPHPPQLCWVGAGWSFTDLGDEEVKLFSKKQPKALIKKLLAKRGDERVLMFYAHKLNEKYIVNWYNFRLQSMIDSVFKRRNSAFTLQLSTDVSGGDVSYKERKMQSFLVKILSILEKDYLP